MASLPRVAVLAVMSACELALPVHEVDGGLDATMADVSLDVSLDTASDTAVDGPVDAGPDATGCNAQGLVAFFPTTEGTGDMFYDCVAGKVGILTGLYKWDVRDAGGGSPRPSITFMENDAGDASAYAEVAQTTYYFGATGATLALWLRVDQYTAVSQVIVTTRGNNNLAEGWSLIANGDGSLSFLMGPNGGGATAGGPSPHVWAHVAVVIQPGTTLSVYVNGALVAMPLFDAGESANGNPLFFGQEESQGGGPLSLPAHIFNGSVGEVRIYNRPLGQPEVMTLAQQ